MKATSVIYKSNKVEIKVLVLGEELLDSTIVSIRFNLDRKKDRFNFVVEFKDETIITKYVGLDNLISVSMLNV